MKRVLITGVGGFIGSHLAEHILLTTDWEIVGLDSLTYAGDIYRLTDLDGYDPKRVNILWHDLRAPIHKHLDNKIGHIDYVINLASESHVDNSIADPVNFIQNNTSLMLNLLEWARTRDIEKFLHGSTDEVYGDGVDHKEWDIIVPSNPYSASKASQEAIAIAYRRTYGIPLIIANMMNAFGERQHPEKFIPKTVKYILEGRPIPIFSAEGRMGSRVWLHVKNHADALVWLLKSVEPDNASPLPDRFNVAGSDRVKTDQLAYMIAGILNAERLELEFVNPAQVRPGYDYDYGLNNSKITNLGWIQPISFIDSLEHTVKWTVANTEWIK